ncbi:MAG: helix-turn-helix transcriptional regulator [Myxococcota bacterium]
MEVRHYQRFSDLVRALRRQHRLSQRALAKALSVSPGYIGQWELRLSQPSPEITVKLCRTFKIVDVEYVQRLAYASRAPDWLVDSIVRYEKNARYDIPFTL